ncbi:bifunctional alpha,alpha-trehalose-phosphate synthase (UDP-forming)/trehalose-phosphatase [Leptospira idonii]|uniref:Bifunctional alpha,alpha-trehalose-phosphate synthase (UDP-forming)/trehalose-phosphatase n=1 Tax=Leptospira idonii TaxID=1193500 RepID=A0A4R9LV74_9LEPT|nr:bifunctional alpha,alpha-trehalose-phosphate synthase (UDP-forming)/trehalose-phosphatase [Leptospira idonii]TGN18133.1 bifunctional alpha,alpha-trehalose-phosphate synthase (UDP-forming)/trehalose-phosphatase [Leptospira idonii]
MRLVLVSNRLPVNLQGKPTIGGLATGLASFLEDWKIQGRPYVWIGWPGQNVPEKDEAEIEAKLWNGSQTIPVFLKTKTFDLYYEGFCNRTIWPLFHYFPSYTDYSNDTFEAYKEVNRVFAKKIIQNHKQGDWIWIHDYHLFLVPQMIREAIPDAKISFFLHIPFPTFEIYRLLPKQIRNSILEGVLGSDLIGFHTQLYSQYFLRSILRCLGLENQRGIVSYKERNIKVGSFPMGIDYEKFRKQAESKECIKKVNKIKNNKQNLKIIISVDRLDYSKGVLQRLNAFDEFIRNNPEWKEKCQLLLIVVPSRTNVPSYQAMKQSIDEKVGNINGKYGNLNWTPILYQYKGLSFEDLVPLYKSADAILITPFRDGMNLVAKEYVACQTDGKGVLILSEMAGAASELVESIPINPNDIEETAIAIKQALEMPEEEKISRNLLMQNRIQSYNVNVWANDIRKETDKIVGSQIQGQTEKLNDVSKDIVSLLEGKESYLFLDYDGTLREFEIQPEKAVPNETILFLLNELCKIPFLHTCIISGRDKNFLEEHFSKLPVTLVAEHGSWIRRQEDSQWEKQQISLIRWKEDILKRLKVYQTRIPGSFIEEKEFSLVWHYRNADPDIGANAAKEILDEISQISSNQNFLVQPGKKIIEVREIGVGKGKAALSVLGSHLNSQIIAIGDDVTDEDLFSSLPSQSITIKVGSEDTHAKYRIKDTKEVLHFLSELIHKNKR